MHLRFLFALMFALVFFASAANAQNLLTNPEFDTNADGWSLFAGGENSSARWVDTDGFPAAGSVELVAIFSGSTASARQCINITPQSVDAVAYSRRFFSGGDFNFGSLQIHSHSAPNCGAFISSHIATRSAVGNEWNRHTIVNFSLPPTTQSVLVVLSFNVDISSGGVFMDHVAFGPSGSINLSETVFENGFE